MQPIYETVGRLAVISIDRPPVNTLSAWVTAGLSAAIAAAEVDQAIGLIVIQGSGDGFSAGLDARELDQAQSMVALSELCQQLEDCGKPVLAALHGDTLGAGLALALAAHYRLALQSASLGFPEVQVGLLPGAGGTQRAPRLMGVIPAAELMLGGSAITAPRAHALGMVDWIVADRDIAPVALAYGEDLVREGARPRRTRDRYPESWERAHSYHGELAFLHDLRRSLIAQGRHGIAPCRIIDALEAALTLPFEMGLAFETRACLDSLNSPPQSARATSSG